MAMAQAMTGYSMPGKTNMSATTNPQKESIQDDRQGQASDLTQEA